MKKIIIIGTGSLGELLFYHLKKSDDYEVAGFSGERDHIPDSDEFLRLPLVPFEVIEEVFPPDEFAVIVAIGHTDMNRNRERIFLACKSMGYSVINYIHPTAYISEGAEIGEGNIILEFAFLAPFTSIGDGNILWNHVKIAHGVKVGNFNSFSGSARISGAAKVADNCFLGADAAVIDEIQLADYTLLGASAVAMHDTDPYEIIVSSGNKSIKKIKSTDFVKISHT